MRHALDAAEPTRHALLALLLDGPCHGYLLAQQFGPSSALGDVVHLSPSHIYALLGRLERNGLVEGERQESGARPLRRVYRLSEAGRAAVDCWIDEPVLRPRDMHLDFPLKLYAARRLDPARAASLIRRQRDVFLAYLDSLEHETLPLDDHPDDHADATFIALMREGRITRTRAALQWLDRCAAAFAAETTVVAGQRSTGGGAR